MKRYHILCWGLPLIIVIIMFGTSTTAESTGYSCTSGVESTRDRYIKKDGGVAFIFVNLSLYLLPLVIVQIFNVYVFRFLSKTLRYMPTVNDLQQKFTRYLLVVIITKAVFIISRFKNIVAPENQSLALTVVMLLGPPIQGLGDFFIYQSSREGRELYRHTQLVSHSTHSTNSSTNSTALMLATPHTPTHSPMTAQIMKYRDDDGEETDLKGSLELNSRVRLERSFSNTSRDNLNNDNTSSTLESDDMNLVDNHSVVENECFL